MTLVPNYVLYDVLYGTMAPLSGKHFDKIGTFKANGRLKEGEFQLKNRDILDVECICLHFELKRTGNFLYFFPNFLENKLLRFLIRLR